MIRRKGMLKLNKVIGFGDLLVSLQPLGYFRFKQADSFDINYTSAESNVCVGLSSLGVPTEFVTKVPNNDIAECAVALLRKYEVNTDKIVYGGDRIGIVYTEKGASQRPSKVVYDRKYTSISTAEREDFDWNRIFDKDAGWFHFTGITAALSDNTALICEDACMTAKEKGLMISCDLNYRKNLWSEEKAKSVMSKLVRGIDVLIANEEDADKVLGIKAANSDVTIGKLSRDGYIEVARKLCNTYGVRYVGITLRQSVSASDNVWSAMLYDGENAYFSKEYQVHIVNRVGGGDAFAAGLIYALSNGYHAQDVIEFAAAASCLKHSIEKDFNLVTVDEVIRLASGDASGRVQR